MEKEELLVQKRLLEFSDQAYERGLPVFTDFLNLNELNIFYHTAAKYSYMKWNMSGGYENAERQIVAFLPDAFSYEIEYPIACLKVEPLQQKFSDTLSHRDFLGAILNLGIDRGKIGDIVLKDNIGYVYCHASLSSFFMEELVKVKHTKVKSTLTENGFSALPQTQEVTGSVSSARIDSILALAFHTSRSSLTQLTLEGRVFVNGKEINSNSYFVKENDVISVRGYGKFVFDGVLSETKKGRLFVRLRKYI